MNSGTEDTAASLHEIKQRLEQITSACGRIVHVAKRETSQLAELCTSLHNYLSGRPLLLQQLNCNDVKSELVRVEEQLTSWSKYKYPRIMIKRKEVEGGVAGFVEKLSTILQAVQGHEQPSRYDTPECHSAESGQPPPIRRLDGEITREGDMAFAGGTYCEVWVGLWSKGNGGGVDTEKVALKALRILRSPEMACERLMRELPSWAELRHQNLLPFYGIVTDLVPRLCMVSPWQENGNLLVYVKNNRRVDKNYLLRGSAAGLSYLHGRDVVHGSVRCRNVLVSHEGEPQICDFGIERIMEDINENTTSKTVSSGDAVRYSAIELIENYDASTTKNSDTYSFALLILECITEEVPFSNYAREAAVIHARISKRQCPSRPDGQYQSHIPDDLWGLMSRCWAAKPDNRPSMEQVHSFFLNQAQQR